MRQVDWNEYARVLMHNFGCLLFSSMYFSEFQNCQLKNNFK